MSGRGKKEMRRNRKLETVVPTSLQGTISTTTTWIKLLHSTDLLVLD